MKTEHNSIHCWYCWHVQFVSFDVKHWICLETYIQSNCVSSFHSKINGECALKHSNFFFLCKNWFFQSNRIERANDVLLFFQCIWIIPIQFNLNLNSEFHWFQSHSESVYFRPKNGISTFYYPIFYFEIPKIAKEKASILAVAHATDHWSGHLHRTKWFRTHFILRST